MIDSVQQCGLLASDLHSIREAVKTLPAIEQLILFGSRAKGTHKTGSDVDLAIKGAAVTYETALQLASILNEERPLPYFFDVVNYHTIENSLLLEHIDRVGVILFDRVAEKLENARTR